MTDAAINCRVIWLTRLLGLGGLALIGVTWKLWTPQDVFPRVPLFWWAPPHWLDWTALGVTLLGLAGLIAAAHHVSGRHLAAAITACGFALLFVSDQHRLQPWAWQFFILATVIGLGDDRTVFYGWGWLVVSIYFWSAVSKFDLAFGEHVSEHFAGQFVHLRWYELWKSGLPGWRSNLSGVMHLVLPSREFWKYLAFGLPIGEFATAMLLSWSRFRRYGLWSSLLMHALLLALLGPFGLNHKPGVLIWNVFFIVQNLVLFHIEEQTESTAICSWTIGGWRNRIATGWLTAVMIWPVSEPWGGCDPWLGWAVYVPPREEAQMTILRSEAARLPRTVDDHLSYACCGNDPRATITESRWSLSSLDVPVYPHPRFQIGVYLDFYHRFSLREGVGQDDDEKGWPLFYVELNRRSGWLNPGYESEPIKSYAELCQQARRYRLNAFPESYYRRRDAERQLHPVRPGS